MQVTKKYQLTGKYAKLFEAKRGKFATARAKAIHKYSQHEPIFSTWEYFSTIPTLTVTWSTAPSYFQEDELFDTLEAEYDSVA
jgi:hypothetical protein